MPASAHTQPLNAARAFEATLVPLTAHRPRTGGDGRIRLVHRDNSGATRVPAYIEASSRANVTLYQRQASRSVGTMQMGSPLPLVSMLVWT